ncbi:MAG: cupin domain-containing protein [Candidatus Natronoplasma sp.]
MEEDKDQLEEIKEQVLELKELVKYQPGSVVSRTLVDKDTVTLTLFAFDEEQTLSEHTSPHDAILQVLEGKARIIINDQKYELEGGKTIVMPANEPHAVEAVDKFKMFLMMVK